MYGLGSLVTKAARFFPNRMAVADENGSFTYLALNDMVNRTANYLLSHGFEKGSRMAFLCDNCKEFAVMYLAAQKSGIVAVLLNYRATRDELSRDVRRSHCEAIFYAPKWKDIISERCLGGSDVRLCISFGNEMPYGHLSLEHMCEATDGSEPEVEIAETDLSTVLYTSGSTGLSKGVVRTHRMSYEYAMQIAAEHEYYKTEPICILSHSPLFHTGGLSMLLKALALCGSYIGVNGVDPERIAPLIEKYRVNQLFLVPPVNIMRLSGSPAMQEHDVSSVNHIWATGGKLSVEYVRTMLELFPGARVKTSYGGTEFCAASSISFVLSPDELENNTELIDSAGYIGMFVDTRLIDENGTEVEPGQPGELVVSSPFVMKEYLDDPEETAKVLRGGWYYTGDVFRIDETGLLHFLDRRSAMIKTGGENVYPNEVESVLREHPDIVDCAIIGLPDAKWGEAVAAAIVPGPRGIDLADVAAFAREKLAGYRKPRYYLLLDSLPRMASAKIDRRALLDGEKYKFISIDDIV